VPRALLSGGAGNDELKIIEEVRDASMTGGAGIDTFVLTEANVENAEYWDSTYGLTSSTLIITDFEVGEGGDVLDIEVLLTLIEDPSYDGGTPFLDYLRFSQDGNDLTLSIDLDGSGEARSFAEVVRLENVTLSSFRAENLSPVVEPDGTLPLGMSLGDADATVSQTLLGGLGPDTLSGGSGNDHLVAYGSQDLLKGGSGNDTLEGGLGHDTLYGEAGSDRIRDWYGENLLYGGDGNDDMGGSVTTLDAGAGGDYIAGFITEDGLIDAGPGDDRIYGEYALGVTTVVGGLGNDQFYNWRDDWNGDGKDGWQIRSHSVVFYGDQLGIESSSDGNDVFHYDRSISDLTIYGGGGSDQLGGGRSWDNLMASSMLLDGGSGDDLVTGSNRYSDLSIQGVPQWTLSRYKANGGLSSTPAQYTLMGGSGDDDVRFAHGFPVLHDKQ
jgi:hypothetical protein